MMYIKVLGFDKFNAEDTMENVDIDGDYISDLAMSKEIIAELEKQNNLHLFMQLRCKIIFHLQRADLVKT